MIPPFRSLIAPWVAVAAVIAGATACHNVAEPGSPTGGPGPSTDLPWADRPASIEAMATDPVEQLAVIDSYVGTSDLQDLVARRDRAAVACLAERGYDVALAPSDEAPTPQPVAVTRAEFAATWGFGLVAPLQTDGSMHQDYAEISQQVSSATTDPPSRAGAVPPVELDPAVYQRSDSTAILVELYGGASVGSDGGVPETAGEPCQALAGAEVGLVEGVGALAAAAELRAQARDRVANDSRVLDLQASYRTCMADKGFPGLDSPLAAFLSISEALTPLRQAAVEATAPGQVPDARSVGPALVRQFEELGAREIAVAVANLECEGLYLEALTPISETIQQRVIDDNPALVAQLGGR